MRLDKTKIPAHVAIIMDGNGRWAQKRGLPRIEGHRRGLRRIKEVIRAAADLGVKVLTLFAFSSENWKRPREEVDFLMASCASFLDKELSMLIQERICFRHIGDAAGLDPSLRACLDRARERTRPFDRMCLQLAFNYGARQEILQAVRRVASDVQEGKISSDAITPELFSRYLYTRDVPDPDLLIRTSGESRVSNFLLWQIAYAELVVTRKFWPDFGVREFSRVISDYQRRARRFGGVDG